MGKTGLVRDTLKAIVDFKPARRWGAGERRVKRQSKAQRNRMISVIIPAHNEEEYIGATLDAVNRQDYRNFEIIVVANGCSDRTSSVAMNKCHRLVVLSSRCLGTARNLGAKLARGELLVFLDADTTLDNKALGTIAREFSNKDAAATVKGCPDGDRLSFRMIYWLKNFVHRAHLHSGSSGVIVCWKKHFVAIRGFDEGLQVRENSELMKRLKRFGRYHYLGRASAVTSMRRYQGGGTMRTLWSWIKLWAESLFRDLHGKEYDPIR